MKGILISIATIVVAGCSPNEGKETDLNATLKGKIETLDSNVHWTERYDFDGDGQNDKLTVSFTGGRYCCYQLTIKLTSNLKEYKLPFELDGGYVDGLDLTQPHRFDIRQTSQGLPELVMEILVFNGIAQPIPELWSQFYGINTHYIAVSFPDATLVARDYPRSTSSISERIK